MGPVATYPVSSVRMPAILELLKPATWFAPMWAFNCGLVSTAITANSRWDLVLGGILLTGPLVGGASQAINDWFDRHVDAINAPARPIPSGRLRGRTGLYVALMLTVLSLGVARLLGPWVLFAASLGLALAWAYSAPPFRLKRNAWVGNSVVSVCYVGLPWVTGAAVMGGGSAPSWRLSLVAALYSIGAVGVMTLKDTKSVEGDRQMGIRSMSVQYGEFNAVAMSCFFMAFAQLVVVGLLVAWDTLSAPAASSRSGSCSSA